ncbi:hypothetical protein GEMRC1_001937 [Eukaryota sp. GEM-RC1]
MIAIAEALIENCCLLKLYLSGAEFSPHNTGFVISNHCGPVGANALASMLCENRVLRELILSNNNVQSEGAVVIAEALEVNESIKCVKLDCNNIDSKGAAKLMKLLKRKSKINFCIWGEENDKIIRGILKRILFDQVVKYKSKDYQTNNKEVCAVASAVSTSRHVRKLYLSNISIDDEDLSAATELLKINTRLTVFNFGTTGHQTLLSSSYLEAFANALAGNTGVQELNFSGRKIGDEGAVMFATALETNSALRTLVLDSNNISGEGAVELFASLTRNSSISSLDLSNNQLNSGFPIDCQVFNHRLVKLRLTHNNIDCATVESLCNSLLHSNSLRHVSLSHNKIALAGVNAIIDVIRTSRIVSLNLNHNNLCNESLHVLGERLIQGNTTLLRLLIGNNDFDAVGIADIVSFLKFNSTLKEIDMTCSHAHVRQKPDFKFSIWNKTTDAAVHRLLQLSCPVKTLDIWTTKFRAGSVSASLHAIITALKHNTSVEEVTIDPPINEMNVMAKYLIDLLKSKPHINFNIWGSDVDLSVKKLLNNTKKSFNELTIQRKLPFCCFLPLVHSLASNSTVKRLELSSSYIGDAGVRALCVGLIDNVRVVELDISKCLTPVVHLETETVDALCYLMQNNHVIQRLKLQGNRITGPDFENLANSLAGNQHLKVLNLANTMIDSDSIKKVTGIVRDCTTLKELYLSYNQINDDGARFLLQSLCNTSSSIEVLDLGHNQMTTLHADARFLFNLRELYLDSNRLTSDTARSLSRILLGNTSLKVLNLSNNCINDDVIDGFRNTIKSNPKLQVDLSNNILGNVMLSSFRRKIGM